jgi:hypothetical protein
MKFSAEFLSVFAILFSLLATAQELQDPLAADEGVIRQVTLYRDQARITREIDVAPGDGVRAIEVTRLPEQIVPESVFAEGNDVTSVRAVRVSSRPVVQSDRDEVRALQQQLAKLQQQRAELQHSLELTQAHLKSLDQMVNFSAVAAKSDLDRGVLNAETVSQLTTFSMDTRRELSGEQFRIEGEIARMDQQLQVVQAKISQLTSGGGPLTYQAKIFVETEGGVAGTVRLNYLVGGCGWTPQYTIRGRIGRPLFELQYTALVRQLSGEDWDRVRLTLSTASPSISAARPVLTPLRIACADVPTPPARRPNDDPFGGGGASPSEPVAALAGQNSKELAQMIKRLREQQRTAETQQGGFSPTNPEQRDLTLNSLAGQMQQIELRAAATSWRSLPQDAEDDIASQTYTLPQPVSLATLRQQQLVQILEAELEGEMYHVATPLLSSFAYREVQMTNTGIGLLSGPASVYLDDRFVGRTHIPSTASGQLLTIGLGADPQIRTRRELLDKQDEVQGGNRRLRFLYRLVLANFKNRPVSIRLIDRMPITRQTQQLSIRLEDPDLKLSDDGLYQRVERPTGLLRWDLTVPEGRHGSEAFDVQYSFTAEFDRSRVLDAGNILEEMQADYQPSRYGGGGMGGMGGFGGGMGGMQ